MVFLNVGNCSAVSVLFGITERYPVDEGPSENLAASLDLCFHKFFIIS